MARSSRRRPLTRLLSAPALAIALLLTCLTVHAQSEPAPAQNLTAEVLPGGGIVLSWDAPAEDAGSITGYEILRRRPNRGENTLLSYVGDTRSNATTYTDLDAREPGEQYVYRVVALRGSSRSGRSNFARLVMPELVPVEPDPADLAPTNLAVRVAADGAALSWDAPAADAATVTGYRVLRSVGASAMTILADTGSDDTTYTDASATTPGETYGYQVLAMRGAETSGGSNTVSVSAPQAPDVPRSAASRVADATAPGNLTVTIVADGIALSWDAPTEGANFLRGYQILRSRAGAPFTIRKASTHSRGTSYVDSWADWPGMTYTYQVKALRGRNVSEGSNQASLTRPACDGGSFNVTPEDVPVTAVPIVVTSTTQDYFVLFVRPILETDLEVPISVTLGESGSTTLQDRLEPLPAAHYRIEKYPVNDPADVDGDCTSDIDELNDLGTKNPLNRATPIVRHNGTVAIPDRETFERLSYQGTDFMFDTHLIELEFVKFFIYGERADRAGVYFMNTNTHRWHNGFFRVVEFPFRHSMRGILVFHPNVIAPDGSLGVYRFEFEPWDTYSFTDVHHAYELLAASMPLLENNLSYYPVPEVLPLYYEEQLQYDASRVSLLFDNDIFPDVSFVQLNQGVGFGLLRSLSLEERPNPRDIVIYESLPNDLPRVAGIITTVPQTPLSHVNLRALQDRAPNAFIRDALDDDTIDSLIGSLVRYTVLRDSYTIRAASKSELDAHYEASRPAAAQAPVRDLTVTAITALSGVAFGDWDAFGVKAANVAVLGTLGFADGTVPDGFAVPFYFYDEFMKANELDAMVTTMLADADFQASYDTQEKELKKLRKAIKNATTPAWMITALEEMHAGFPEGTSLRYRSSTNNEDLPGFSGAGLYDSKTQDPDETEEDGIDKSIKGVWASLWNFRAFVERDFNRIDHSATAMGVLVHPNYSDELANGVAVSYDPPTNRTGAYYVNTQVGEDLVTNPVALSVPEQLLLLSDGSYEVIVRSNQVESNELLMTDAQIAQLRGHLATIHSSFKTLYAPAAGERFAMEIEFKITSDNVLAIKQARPWVFRPLNEPAAFPNTETGERTIAEGTPSNVAIGDPVAATDPDDDALTYTLSGADADWFRVDSSSGQLLTEKPLDFETQDRHEVDITVGDPFNAATTTIMVTINVTDVDEPADITFTEGSNVTANGNALTVDENYAGSLATFRADDPESTPGLTYQWSVVGTDGGDFAFTAEADTRSGELSFAANPDYERPADSVGNNVYDITVNARDSDNKTGRINVTVTVLPVNEPPIISGATEVNLNEVVDPTPGQVVRVDTYTKSDPDRRPPQTTNWGPIGSTTVLSGDNADVFDFDQQTGRLTFASPPDYENGGGRYQVTLTANDGAKEATLDVTVNVANVEEAGTLALGARRGVFNVPLVATLEDPDVVATQTWKWQRSTSLTSGWMDIANADSNSYTPGADDRDNYLRASVTYTDGTGPDETTLTADTELPTRNNASTNQPPTPPDPLPQVADVPEDAPAGRNVVLVVFTDPEGEQELTYSLSGSDEFAIGSSSGLIVVGSGELNYEVTRSYSVTVSAADSFGAAGMVTLTIGISDVDEPPGITLASAAGSDVTVDGSAVSVEENHTSDLVNVTATDPESTHTDYTLLLGGTHSTSFTLNTGVLSFTNPPDHEAREVYNLTLTASNASESSTLDVTVTVGDVNEPPEITLASAAGGAVTVSGSAVSVEENHTSDLVNVTATDPETTHTDYTLALGGTHSGSFTLNSTGGAGVLSFTNPPDHEVREVYRLTLTASNASESSTLDVTVTVRDVDEPPGITLASAAGGDVTVSGSAVSVEENHTSDLVNVTATDPESTHTDYTLVLGGTHATSFTLNSTGATGVLSFTNPPDHEAREVYRLTLTASNASESSTLNVTVTVGDVNEPPIISGATEVNLNEVVDPTPGQVVRVDTYTKSDPDRSLQTTNWGPLGSTTVLSGANAEVFDFDLPTGALTFKRPPDYENGGGRYQVTLTANDGAKEATLDVTVNVANVEEAGTLALGARRGVFNVPLVATLEDPDVVATQTWKWQRSTSLTSGWMDIANADSNSYTPGADDRDNYLRASVSYTDGAGPDETTLAAATELPTVNDASTNEPPTPPDPLPQVAAVPEDALPGRNVVQVEFTDPEGEQQLTYSLISDEFVIGSGSGRITVKSGELNYEETTSYSVTVSAADSYGAAGMVMLRIGISNVNEAPTAADFVVTVPEDETVDIDVVEMASDEDAGDTLTVARVERHPEAGTATVNDGTNDITYTPRANYHGSDNFTYQVKDGAGLSSNIATVAITIDPVNDAPTFASPTTTRTRSVSESARAGDDVGERVTATDIDAGDSLAYSLSGPDVSSFEIDSEGQITVAERVFFDITAQAIYTVMVSATDSATPPLTATVEVTITVVAGPVVPPTGGGGGGGGGGGPSPSVVDFEWSVTRDIEDLGGGHDKPSGTWSDGTTLWVLENGSGADDAIYAYDLKTGERVEDREFELDETNRAPRSVWSDRTVLWVSDSGQERLFAHDLETGERLPERDIALADRNRDARGIWSDTLTMWVLDGGKESLFAYDLASGESLAEYALDDANDDPRGLFFDGVTFWVSDHGEKRIFAYRLEAGEDGDDELARNRDEEFPSTVLSRAGNNSPRGLWSDGDVMYVADESDARVYTYNMPNAIDARLSSLTLSGVDIGEFDRNRTDYEAVVAGRRHGDDRGC